jgi:hypothetical protein
MAEAAAALQAQITAAVTIALAAQAAAALPVAHVVVNLPEFWVKNPKMWFSQAEAQFRRARITAEATMYDYVLMKLPEDVVMSVRALVSAIEADPVKQEYSLPAAQGGLARILRENKVANGVCSPRPS